MVASYPVLHLTLFGYTRPRHPSTSLCTYRRWDKGERDLNRVTYVHNTQKNHHQKTQSQSNSLQMLKVQRQPSPKYKWIIETGTGHKSPQNLDNYIDITKSLVQNQPDVANNVAKIDS
ncbi:hypothetical protein Smp_140930 [Schistosoma mansoni]|uniref:hypothetical protein n=1 Tax=Schistosoma mansoni TaxID=6183 RepID=UPI0001A6434B|nr:hypothetical protein Smp_140930 [Schistosoma mansoni]|eukprot:XP_018648107.1 hypothetical protein Smp_140930 [Schistosoma mansoni]